MTMKKINAFEQGEASISVFQKPVNCFLELFQKFLISC